MPMKLEILFPEFCNLFGDSANVRYLRQCLPEAEFIETPLRETPRFVSEAVDFLYLGPMTERTQEKVIEKLRPFAGRLEELIEGGTVMLFTGNAIEVLGEYIENEDGSRIEGLGLLPLTAKRDMMHRHNSIFVGTFEGREFVAFKSQFTMGYPGEGAQGLFPRKKGVGLNKKCEFEGLRKNNFFGTYLLGPILLMTPDFTRCLLDAMGAKDAPLAFEGEVRAALEARLKDFYANEHDVWGH